MRASRLPGGRLHLADGPIDLIIKADAEASAVEAAYAAAALRVEGLLAELVAELPLLRTRIGAEFPALRGAVARRMAQAAFPYRQRFVTPMVAVAGAVAEAVLDAMAAAAPLERAFVNNGGDIALHLSAAAHLDLGVMRLPEEPEPQAFMRIEGASGIRGVATSGRHGRSFSLGIADAVTVLARRAADADAAATMIANAVDVGDVAIERRPARQLDPDSDLLDIPVTVAVGALAPAKIGLALAAGRREAEALIAAGRIAGALISLAGQWESVGDGSLRLSPGSRGGAAEAAW